MILQRQSDDWDWSPIEIASKIEKNRICSICRESFTSAKKVKQHKKIAHSY